MKRNRLFWGIEACLYLLFCSGDGLGLPWKAYGNELKYGSLLLCFVYMVSIWWKGGKQERKAFLRDGCLVGIVGFSALADYFLLFTDWFVWGILLFAVVQGWYRVAMADQKHVQTLGAMYGISLGITAMVAESCTRFFHMQWDGTLILILTAIFYGICLIQNTGLGVWLWKKSMPYYKEETVFLYPAIVLLCLCDIHVGLYNLNELHLVTAESGILAGWCQAAGTLMWAFYLTSQLCVLGELLYRKNQ